MSYSTTLTDTLQQLRQPQQVNRARLKVLTDLRERDFVVFWHDWVLIPPEARVRIVTLMNEISEENLELDYRPIMRWLLADDDAEVRRRAIDGLSEEEHPRIIEPLLNSVMNDPDDTVRSAAAVSLTRFTILAAVDELSETHTTLLIDSLQRALTHHQDKPDVYRRILESLGPVADDTIRTHISKAWQSKQTNLRESALVAMGLSQDNSWLPIIRTALEDGHAAIRYEAARAAGEYADQASMLVPLLVNLTHEDDIEVAGAAIWALGQIGDERSVRALKQLSKSRDQAKRDAALTALDENDGSDELFGNINPFGDDGDDDDDDRDDD
jgi:HEAT repeat protein